jgi:DNA polymerase III epsilon subunit-like protein
LRAKPIFGKLASTALLREGLPALPWAEPSTNPARGRSGNVWRPISPLTGTRSGFEYRRPAPGGGLKQGMQKNVIFWDTETNGLYARNSVLSISAIKCGFAIDGDTIQNSIIDTYERFYFRKPGEQPGLEALDVNELTDDVIHAKRADAVYPLHFKDDIESFKSFCDDTRHFAGHNIRYDMQYINFALPNTFCTMNENLKIVKARRGNGRIKYPSLFETIRFYNINSDSSMLHGSLYDSMMVYEVFKKMLETGAREKVLLFLEKE